MERLSSGLPDQPGRRRCRRPRHLREDARARSAASPRRSATSRTASRWCRTAEGTLKRSPLHAASASASWPSSFKNGTLSAGKLLGDPERGSTSLASEIERLGASAEFNGIKLLSTNRHDHLPGGRQRTASRSASRRSRSAPWSTSVVYQLTATRHDGHHGDRQTRSTPSRRSAPSSALSRTASSTRCRTSAIYQENLVAAESRIPRRSTWRRRRST